MELKTIEDLKRYVEILKKHKHHPKDFIFGLELEGILVDTEGNLLETKELIRRLNDTYYDFSFSEEAGACQLEIKSYPREYSTDALKEKEEYLMDIIEDIVDLGKKIHGKDTMFLLIGSNPHPDILSDRWISNNERAKKLALWRSNFSPVKIGDIYIKPQHIALAIQSIHVHIQGRGADDTIDKFNRLLYMIPEHIALSANSPIIGGRITDYAEARLPLYEIADGGNAGFPKLKQYPATIIDYGKYILSYKPIIASNLAEMVKERHEDVRIKFEIPLRVESRACAIQSTIRENMALVEYIVGRLKYAQRWSRMELPALKEIEINRTEAIKEALRGKFIWNGKSINVKDYLSMNIEKAEKGIESLDSKARYLHILKRRIKKRKTSSDVIKRWYKRCSGNIHERVGELINKIWEYTRKNKPIL
ncbi:MAG: hypothetical protein FE047_01680 [Thermoplasmata archaeon]|nr:MAG: hypothetical protein FE047_01680 [Thermoplasmata archaeon]KAA0011073.1 MAG: hypothetical protein FE041_04455 [Thermoplasmata archaeon]OYT61836.1 MAG: hypothetical protein B6U81_02175 [Thermoplasmatales archaeon ex4484_30]